MELDFCVYAVSVFLVFMRMLLCVSGLLCWGIRVVIFESLFLCARVLVSAVIGSSFS